MGQRINFVAGDEGIETTSTVIEDLSLPRAPEPKRDAEFDKAAEELMNEPTGVSKPKPASQDQKIREEAMKEPSVLGNPEKRPSKIDEIMEKIGDPQAAKADLARLIAWEMASLLAWIDKTKGNSGEKSLEVKNLLETLKGVRELGKQLIEADDANQDYINFDGNKFKKVMDHWFETSKEALHEIGFDDNTIKNFIMHWADILGKTDIKLRREVQDIK